MRNPVLNGLLALLLLGAGAALAQQQPADIGERERVEVNLVLVDVVVLDGQGRTVSGLGRDDFQLSVQGRAQAIDTFDVACPAGGVDEPQALGPGEQRVGGPAPAQARRLVLLLDYYHTPLADRHWVMQQVKAMVARGKTDAEELMVAALADGLRIEQRFTADRRAVLAALERMEHDTSLWAREFQPLTERSFFDNLAILMDTLSFTDGSKAVVLFSGFGGSASAQDLWFQQVAERAALSRTSIYPADIVGLTRSVAGGSGALARLANESGGRMTERTNDLSLAYARAQHDLACRYTLGFYVQPDEGRARRQVRVRVPGQGRNPRAPEWIRVADEQDRRESMLRAAFADPELFEHPLVRLAVYPLQPASRNAWTTLSVLHFPVPVSERAVDLEVAATLARDGTVRSRVRRAFAVAPAEGGGDVPVTVVGDAQLKPGRYRLTALLSRADGGDRGFSASSAIDVPEVPSEGAFIRGPILARAVHEGLLLRATKNGMETVPPSGRLREIIGAQGTFEPLIVQRVEADDTLIAAWSLCTVDRKWQPPAGALLERTVVARAGGREAYRFEPLALGLPSSGKARCQGMIDTVPAAELAPGSYQLEVALRGDDGELLARGLAIFLRAGEQP